MHVSLMNGVYQTSFQMPTTFLMRIILIRKEKTNDTNMQYCMYMMLYVFILYSGVLFEHQEEI